MSQEPGFGSLFGTPAGAPSDPQAPVGAGESPATHGGGHGSAGAAWWRRREVAVAAAATGAVVVLGAVGLVVLGGGGDDVVLGGGVARAAVPSVTSTTAPAPTESATGSGGRNPFGDKAAVGGNTTGTALASTSDPTPVGTVTKTVSGPVVTATKTVTKVTVVTATVTADPVYLYLRTLSGAHGAADFTVNEDQVDGVDEGDTFSSGRMTYTGTTSATCLSVTYEGHAYALCEGDVVKLG